MLHNRSTKEGIYNKIIFTTKYTKKHEDNFNYKDDGKVTFLSLER